MVKSSKLKKTTNAKFISYDDPSATYPAYEPIEALALFDDHIYSAGQRGSVRCWSLDGSEKDPESGRRTKTPNQPDLESYHSLMVNSSGLIAIDNNHNIHFLNGESIFLVFRGLVYFR